MPRTYLCSYVLDNGNPTNVALDAERAIQGGFGPGNPADGPAVKIHGKYLKCRGVWGRTGGGKKMFLPCATPIDLEAVFNGGSFAIGSDTYVVTGKRGEQDSIETPLP